MRAPTRMNGGRCISYEAMGPKKFCGIHPMSNRQLEKDKIILPKLQRHSPSASNPPQPNVLMSDLGDENSTNMNTDILGSTFILLPHISIVHIEVLMSLCYHSGQEDCAIG